MSGGSAGANGAKAREKPGAPTRRDGGRRRKGGGAGDRSCGSYGDIHPTRAEVADRTNVLWKRPSDQS